jgi:predicted nucleotidyltransferase
MKIEQIKKIIEEVKDVARQEYKAEIVGIFGSFARDEGREDSDIDILVRFLKGATLFDLVGLADFLEEKLKRKVDVVSERALRQEIKKYVTKEMVRL